ncbi:hypothetical protein BP6252_06591 [Coleophoma cylindrospora]|uniref:Heterokaryon incompatibility domain-containing protein n=1 Tax=Coleophoma cylindrospora TaxID=1849047 RepID=A0A3D8RN26_9HELO|nr:hypothetical protein BP6252_06591 [Coleophoma cylindrospora]
MSGNSYKGAGRAYLRPSNDGASCVTCQNLSTDEHTSTKQVILIEAFDLAESADEGYCKWCSLVYRSLLERGAELPTPGNRAFARVVAQPNRPFYVQWTSQQQRRITAEIYQIASNGPSLPNLGYAAQILPDLTSDSVFQQISSWIQHCEETHEDCNQTHPSTPRRLLDIGDPLQNANARTIRLVQDIREPVKYIALSHCWGKNQNLTTTSASLESRLTSISWDDLPKTYQDAITVLRRLNLRYIWIDSLCILQDDDLDWATESSKMSDIYEDSYLTLAAALAPGDDYGFLNPVQERKKHLGAPLDLSDYGINEDTVWVREIHDNRTLESPQWLASRAWTLQESLIPPRLLTFSVTTSFECRAAQHCECGSGLFPDPFCGNTEDFEKIDRTECARILESSVSNQEVYNYWYRKLLAPYSRRELTNLNDRLPALSGLASKFSLRLNDNYLAGLWEKDLITGLTWETNDPCRNLLDRAPSWSWASVEGSIEKFAWESRSMEMSLEILDVQVTTDPAGMVRKGSLRVYGMMCMAFLNIEQVMFTKEWQSPRDGQHDYKYSLVRKGFENENDAIIHTDFNVGPALKFDTPLSVGVAKTSNGESLEFLQRSFDDPSQFLEPVSGNVLCVLLHQSYVKNERHLERVYLVLGPNSSDIGVYYRLGIVTVRADKDSHVWFEDIGKDTIIIR